MYIIWIDVNEYPKRPMGSVHALKDKVIIGIYSQFPLHWIYLKRFNHNISSFKCFKGIECSTFLTRSAMVGNKADLEMIHDLRWS